MAMVPDCTSELTLPQWLTRIEALHPAEIELGLTRLRQVAERLALLPLTIPVITVAGTNGKGSTLALLRALAQRRGERVALYTSPHLHRFNERICLPDGLASDAQLCAAFVAIEQARGDIALTYFEFTTLAALWLFARSDATLVLLEVGLGGRLDALNLVDADVAVVTSIGLDHQDWLGNDRETIAAEKCAIARPGRPLVYGERHWPANLLALCEQLQCQPLLAGQHFSDDDGQLRLANGQRLRLPATVTLGADNLASACQALVALGVQVSDDDLLAVADTAVAGRCEWRQVAGIQCWLDVGHNLEAVQRFVQRLPALAAGGRRHLVFAMMKDKPVSQVMNLFAGQPVQWYLGELAMARACSVAQLQQHCPAGQDSRAYDSVAEACRAALAAARQGDQLLVFGSFFTVAEAGQVLVGAAPTGEHGNG